MCWMWNNISLSGTNIGHFMRSQYRNIFFISFSEDGKITAQKSPVFSVLLAVAWQSQKSKNINFGIKKYFKNHTGNKGITEKVG